MLLLSLGYNHGDKRWTWLYDATTNQFEIKSDMVRASYHHSAVLLPGSSDIVLVGYGTNTVKDIFM